MSSEELLEVLVEVEVVAPTGYNELISPMKLLIA
jgi:hypothetical protein